MAEPRSRGRGTHHPRGDSRTVREGRPALAQPDSSPRRPHGCTWGTGVRRTVGSHTPARAGSAPEPVHRHRVGCGRGPVHGARGRAGAGRRPSRRARRAGARGPRHRPVRGQRAGTVRGAPGCPIAAQPGVRARLRWAGVGAHAAVRRARGARRVGAPVLDHGRAGCAIPDAPVGRDLPGRRTRPAHRAGRDRPVGSRRHRVARGRCAGGPDRRPGGRGAWWA